MSAPEPQTEAPAIRTAGLGRTFDSVPALEGLDLEVPAGELFGLVGPDGSGKTTTLRLLAALMPPSSGRAWVAGLDVVREQEAVHDAIGYVPQRFGLYPDLTVSENVSFFADLYGVPRSELAVSAPRLLSWARLEQFRGRLAGNLSGGMKQKLALACALIHTPRVLLLDEPTAGVDPVSRRDFWLLLKELLAERVTIFVSTSYLDEAEKCDRVGLLFDGKLLACASPEELRRQGGGRVIEIMAPDPRRALGVVRETEGESAASLFGDRIHLAVEDPTAGASRVRYALGQAGIAVSGMREVAPTLEDVFVSAVSARRKPDRLSGPAVRGKQG